MLISFIAIRYKFFFCCLWFHRCITFMRAYPFSTFLLHFRCPVCCVACMFRKSFLVFHLHVLGMFFCSHGNGVVLASYDLYILKIFSNLNSCKSYIPISLKITFYDVFRYFGKSTNDSPGLISLDEVVVSRVDIIWDKKNPLTLNSCIHQNDSFYFSAYNRLWAQRN